MKNKFKLTGIIALVAGIGFSIAACDYDVVVSEAPTNGRLTITGLSAYEDKSIWADSKDYRKLKAYKSAENMYNKADNTSWSFSRTRGEVVSGQVVLKVFEDHGDCIGDSGGFQFYLGNDKNVKFDIAVQDKDTNSEIEWVGTVTVNFTKGIGSGAFVPK